MKKLAVAFTAVLLLASNGWAEAQSSTRVVLNSNIDSRSEDRKDLDRPEYKKLLRSYMEADQARAKHAEKTPSVTKISKNSYGQPSFVEPSRK